MDIHIGESGSPSQNHTFDAFLRAARADHRDWADFRAAYAALCTAAANEEVTEAQAAYLDHVFQARQGGKPAAPVAAESKPRGVSRAGSREISADSWRRRRRKGSHDFATAEILALIGRRYAWALQVVANIVGLEIAMKGQCTLSIDAIGAFGGYGRTSVQEALSLLAGGPTPLIRIEARRHPRSRRSLSNRITVVCAAWRERLKAKARILRGVTKAGLAYFGLAPRGHAGELGSNFAGSTGLQGDFGIGLSADISAQSRPAAGKRLSGMESARSGPAGPMHGVPG